jgi:hypothetical protein
MLISFNKLTSEFNCSMKGSMTHSATLSNDPSGCISRINNAFDKIPDRLLASENQLQTLHEQMENAKTELAKPFAFEADLAVKSARLAELDASLDMSGASAPAQDAVHDLTDDVSETAAKQTKTNLTVITSDRPDTVSAKARPSLFTALKKGDEKSRTQFGGGDLTAKTKDAVI